MAAGQISRLGNGGQPDGDSAAAGWCGRDEDGAVQFVESLVASAFGIEPGGLRAASRGRARIALARQIAIYLIHTRLGFSFSQTGEVFGRDRTTAAHACRIVENSRDEPGFDATLDCLEHAVDLWPGLAEPGGGKW
jgi:uncharacterized membrane protein YtjA (UPF0391 family)